MSNSIRTIVEDGKKVELIKCRVCSEDIYVEPGKGGGEFGDVHYNCLTDEEREEFMSDDHMEELHKRYGL